MTRNIHLEAENGARREFVEQLQFRVGELQERIVELQAHRRSQQDGAFLPFTPWVDV
jgi:hypothetical protein